MGFMSAAGGRVAVRKMRDEGIGCHGWLVQRCPFGHNEKPAGAWEQPLSSISRETRQAFAAQRNNSFCVTIVRQMKLGCFVALEP